MMMKDEGIWEKGKKGKRTRESQENIETGQVIINGSIAQPTPAKISKTSLSLSLSLYSPPGAKKKPDSHLTYITFVIEDKQSLPPYIHTYHTIKTETKT